MKKNAKKFLSPEQLKSLEDLKKKQLEVFEEQLEIMKTARDVLWDYCKNKCKNLSEAKNMIQIMQASIFSAFDKKKSDFNVSDLDVKEFAKGYDDLIDNLSDKSIIKVEKAFNAMSQILEAKIKDELKSKDLKDFNDTDMFYYDDAELDKKKEKLVKDIEEDYRKRV